MWEKKEADKRVKFKSNKKQTLMDQKDHSFLTII